MGKFEIRRSNDPVDRWDILVWGHYWTSTLTKWGARRAIKKYWNDVP